MVSMQDESGEEELNSIRKLLSQAMSEMDPVQASELVHELSELMLILAHNLPIEKMLVLMELFVEAMELSVKTNLDMQKKIAELTEKKPADNKEDE